MTSLVNTSGGSVLGSRSGPCAAIFYGIPYAAPPIGPLRWRPPQPAAAWAGVRDARLNDKPRCLQAPDGGALILPAIEWREETAAFNASHNEDCLFVNVASPRLDAQRPLPVMVYIHGGSYLAGSGAGGASDPRLMCAEDVVLVSMNYRLGALGALALPELLSESGTVGNLPLLDQRAALRWVRANIAAFGGDPSRVTISGESAGAMSVLAHYALERSRGLFSQAIAMSGNDDSTSLSEAIAAGERFAAHVGCGAAGGAQRLDCLRAASGFALINAQAAVYNGTMRTLQLPVADGRELGVGRTLRSVYARGEAASGGLPLLAGTNRDDISLFLGFTWPEILREIEGRPMVDRLAMNASLPRLLPTAPPEVLAGLFELYEPTAHFGGDARRAMYELCTDGYFACPTRRALLGARRASAGAAVGSASFYHYLFNSSIANVSAWLGLPPDLAWISDDFVAPWLGAFHGANEYLFWNAANATSALTPAERALGSRLVRHWGSFVRTGRPLADWPAAGEREAYRLFDATRGDSSGERWHSTRCEILQDFRFVWAPLGT